LYLIYVFNLKTDKELQNKTYHQIAFTFSVYSEAWSCKMGYIFEHILLVSPIQSFNLRYVMLIISKLWIQKFTDYKLLICDLDIK